MKKISKLVLGLLLLATASTKAQFGDPAINILMVPSGVQLNQTGILQVDLGNFGNSNIVANSLRATISVGTNAEIIGIQTSTSDPRWTQANLTSGLSNTIQLRNTGGGIPAFDAGTINLIVRGSVESPASTITGNIVYIAGINPLISAPNASQGNGQTQNDNSTTSLTVVAGGPLPVKLDYVLGSMNRCEAEITWKSSLELNFKQYELQYSADGARFSSVSVVPGAGVGVVYKARHTPTKGAAFYRLKSVDLDGKVEFSRVVRLESQCGLWNASVFPNPARDRFQINVNGIADGTVANGQLVGPNGQVVRKVIIRNGANQVDCRNLSAGVYSLQVWVGNTQESYKIILTGK